MRCSLCNDSTGGMLGALRARGISCSNPSCDAVYCSNCLALLASSHDEGLGPLKHAVLELRCSACQTVLQRVVFRTELQAAALDAVKLGRTQVHALLLQGRNLRSRARRALIERILQRPSGEPKLE